MTDEERWDAAIYAVRSAALAFSAMPETVLMLRDLSDDERARMLTDLRYVLAQLDSDSIFGAEEGAP